MPEDGGLLQWSVHIEGWHPYSSPEIEARVREEVERFIKELNDNDICFARMVEWTSKWPPEE